MRIKFNKNEKISLKSIVTGEKEKFFKRNDITITLLKKGDFLELNGETLKDKQRIEIKSKNVVSSYSLSRNNILKVKTLDENKVETTYIFKCY